MKYKSIIILVLTIFVLISIAGASATDTNDTAIASGDANQIDLSQNDEITDDLKASGDAPLTQPDNDETLSVENTPEIGSDDEGTYFDLIKEITNGGNKLSKSYYRYTGGETINIIGVDLDGNGAVIDMAGSSNVRVFSVMYETTVKNLTIKNVNYNGYGGAILFERLGTVEDCNFINNTAYAGSAIYFEDSRYQGTVKNCNFVDNKETAANKGGAIYSMVSVDITNCTFTNNSASCGGAIYSMGSRVDITNCTFTNNSASCGGAIYSMGNDVDITNCTFTNNKATGESGCGGAIYSMGNDVDITNCTFTGNNATTGSAILSPGDLSSITVSNSHFLNNRANVIGLLITKNDDNIIIDLEGENNFLNAIYATGVTFTNVTYWGANGIANTDSSTPSKSFREAGQNITVSIVVNDLIVLNEVRSTDENGRIVFDISAGENYFIGARHDTDSYYTEKVQTISNNIKFNVNVTSQTTNNKTVNITAKSNIPNEFINGKLIFIVPNTNPINATYAGNGTWWAVYTFDNAGDYSVNASYIGLDNVSINNATISIRFDACVDVNNKTLDLLIDDTFTIVATTTPEGLKVNYVPDDSGVYSIDENGVVTALRDGDGSILIKVGGDGIYAPNSTIVNVTVSKIPTNISVNTVSLDLFVGNEAIIVATLTPADAGNVTFKSSDENLVLVEDDGNVIANGKGQAIITVSFAGNDKYAAANKTINVTVKLNNANVTVDKDTLDLKVDETYTINATKNPDTILLDITYKSSDKSVATVNKKGIVTAVGVGTAIITVSVGDDEIYAENSTKITVTVKKSTPKLTAKAKTFKDTDKNKRYTVTLKNSKGKPIKNTKVYLKVNGKTYTAKTNSKGQATFKITKLAKKGTYTATITYKGNKNYNKITKKAKIAVKQTWKTISKGSKNHAMVKKIQKALKKNGFYIKEKGRYLKIDGIFHKYTVKAVKQFQKAKKLKVTGKVDYNTAKKLKLI